MKTTVVSSPAFELLADIEPNALGYHLSLSTRIPIANHPTAIPKLTVNLSAPELIQFSDWLQQAVTDFGLKAPASPPPQAAQQDWLEDGRMVLWFEVDEFDTLFPSGHVDPETRRGLLDFTPLREGTNHELIRALEEEWLTSQWASRQAQQHAEELLHEMKSLKRRLTAQERARVRIAHDQIDSAGERWRDLVLTLTDEEQLTWLEELDKWLDDSPDSEDWEHLPSHTTGQLIAFNFFESMPAKDLEALGVVTIEGDRPGSSYIAAELRTSIEEANEAAQRLGLTCRFCRPGDRTKGDGRSEA